MSFIVGGSGANSRHPNSLAVGDAPVAMRRMATTMVEVLLGVSRLGLEISDQAVPAVYHCGIQERYGLPRALSREFDGRME